MLRAIVAGWLIAILVWMLPAAQTSHFFVIVVITWVIGVGHFSHVIAGSANAFYLVGIGDLSLAASLGRFVVPALLGNVIGGVTLVAALNHAQVVSGGGKG